MRWLWLLPILGLCGFSPIYQAHDNQRKVDDEFVNVYGQAQPDQFKVFNTTPNLTQLKDGEAVIFSCSTVKMMFRSGQEIFAVGVSCITVRR